MKYKEKVISFLWQHLLLLASLYVMTLGVAVCVRSAIGSSVISTIPYVLQLAGAEAKGVPAWTIGQYTIAINTLFVVIQIAILRRDFEWVQLCQLIAGAFFGSLIDVNMWLTTWLVPQAISTKIVTQVIGCIILGTGIAMEIRCGSITMPGEGMPIAICKVTGAEFPKIKIVTDTTLVCLAIVLSYVFFGAWQWQITGVGTLFAMVFVGMVVKVVGRHMSGFERLLHYQPGFRRYIYGLARHIRH